ncbi:hypothetical protein ACHAXA_006178 [Cyclostephanos tholiformis]|uniref:Uncharacterized protein n=1 Tax=Cyclostephanos tholiformis TaxID=382380 RepID=A0ABD3R5E5_9STRA
MGTYFRGANAFRDRYSSIVNDASVRGVPTFVFGLHKLWRERCKDQTGPCARCNTAGKELAFREAVGHVATERVAVVVVVVKVGGGRQGSESHPH